MKDLLTDVIISIVNDKLKRDNSFGISIINLPDIDFERFIASISHKKKLELYFLGYDNAAQETIFYKGIMPSEKVLDFPVDCNTLTGSVNL